MAGNQAIREKLAGRRVVASVSGGKDSAAMSLWLTEQGIDHDRVFCDTGWEHPATYGYLRGPLAAKLGPIVEVRGEIKRTDLIPVESLRPRVRAAVESGSAMVELVLRKMMFPGRTRRFCTEHLKVEPLKKYLNGRVDGGEDIANAVGIRRGESVARSKMSEWEWSKGFDCEVWRPLIEWSEQDVIDIHQRHGLAPNPLYLRGARRVGCWPCINSSKVEIRLLAEIDPERVALLRELEADMDEQASARFADRGDERRELRTWFQAPIDRGGKKRWTIDEVIAWSRTSRGGRQFELFTAPGDDGCMRWGMCETAEDEVPHGG